MRLSALHTLISESEKMAPDPSMESMSVSGAHTVEPRRRERRAGIHAQRNRGRTPAVSRGR